MMQDAVLPTANVRKHSHFSLRAFRGSMPNRKLANVLRILVLLFILQFSIRTLRFFFKGVTFRIQWELPDGDQARDGTATTLKQWTSAYERAIMNPEDTFFNRSACPAPTNGRYDYLMATNNTQLTNNTLSTNDTEATPFHNNEHRTNIKYFFALDLFNCAPLLPRLLGSIVEAIRFLGPENCALSIVEGRSKDGTGEILQLLQPSMKELGVKYFLQSSLVAPLSGEVDRMAGLAELRNDALKPLVENKDDYTNATVIFINDIALCMEDILELVHQRFLQNADMTCAMDWIAPGDEAMFYDVYVSRTITGDTFFDIPKDGSWDHWNELFADDQDSFRRFQHKIPFQVFACWNGVTAFTAKPIIDGSVRFRGSYPEEPYAGEPTLFCKDMTKQGYGKIAVIPSVNVAYSDDEAALVKESKGYVSKWTETDTEVIDKPDIMIQWQGPPEKVRWAPNWQTQNWGRWDKGLIA